MAYTQFATAKSPALIVYLLDVSGSMDAAMGPTTRHAALKHALMESVNTMIRRSTSGAFVAPRYHVAMYAYSEQVTDLLGGRVTIADLADMDDIPLPAAHGSTNTRAAFAKAQEFLSGHLPQYQHCPAPMVCHITDGEWNVADWAPTAEAAAIRNMSVADGNVLVMNAFIGEGFTPTPIKNAREWLGVRDGGEVANDFARRLFELSSPFPAAWAAQLKNDTFYKVSPDAKMLIPATNPELLELALAMSQATPTR